MPETDACVPAFSTLNFTTTCPFDQFSGPCLSWATCDGNYLSSPCQTLVGNYCCSVGFFNSDPGCIERVNPTQTCPQCPSLFQGSCALSNLVGSWFGQNSSKADFVWVSLSRKKQTKQNTNSQKKELISFIHFYFILLVLGVQ